MPPDPHNLIGQLVRDGNRTVRVVGYWGKILYEYKDGMRTDGRQDTYELRPDGWPENFAQLATIGEFEPIEPPVRTEK